MAEQGRGQRLSRWLAPPAPAVARQPRRRIGAVRAYAEVAAVYVLGFGPAVASAFYLLNHPGHILNPKVPTLHGQVVEEAISWAVSLPGLLLALWLMRRRGWTLPRLGIAPRWITGRARRRQAIAIGAVMFAGQIVAAVVLTALAPHAGFPFGRTGAWGMIGGISGAVRSGFLEELVITAFVITTLRQARRPWPEILVVSLALRVAYHVYYGTPWIVLWIAIWAGTAFWLYQRTRRLTPIMVAHALWDAQGFTLAELGHIGNSIISALWLAAILGGFVLFATRTTASALTAQTSSR
jgi:membrane protease YdiL (CAAX protease family)